MCTLSSQRGKSGNTTTAPSVGGVEVSECFSVIICVVYGLLQEIYNYDEQYVSITTVSLGFYSNGKEEIIKSVRKTLRWIMANESR